MTHAYTFNVAEPTDSNFLGDGDDKIIENQKALKERLILDHHMAGVLDTNLSNADGRHKQVTLKALAADPTILGNSVGDCTFAESETSIGTCTITNADPCVITCASHGLATGDKVHFDTSSALPTGITAGTIYYVIYINANTFSIAETYLNAILNSTHPSGTSGGTVTIDVATEAVVTLAAHGFQTGERIYFTTTGALPTGLSANTDYYVIEYTDNTFKVASSLANALAGTAIATTVVGSGTHTLYYHNKIKTSSAGAGTHTLTKNNGVIVTLASHGLATGRMIYFTTTGADLPEPLDENVGYFLIYIDANTFYIASSYSYAMTSKTLSITDVGSGTHTLYSGTQNYGVVYTKVVDGVTEVFVIESNTGVVQQISENGVVSAFILQNNIDCNDKELYDGIFQGIHKSVDGSSGYTGTITFTEYMGVINYYNYTTTGEGVYYYYHRYGHFIRTTTITVKNGLIISYTNGSTVMSGPYWDVLYYSA